ncbi:hypothetical protein HC341_00890 [Aquisalimonas sp. 2447]|nr:hypothetical protein HC341_00890 [Aquisalimonas sp. 2447]
MNANAQDVKQAAHELIDQLPDNASWDDVVYRMAVRRAIEIGLTESDANEGVDTATVRAELDLPGE